MKYSFSAAVQCSWTVSSTTKHTAKSLGGFVSSTSCEANYSRHSFVSCHVQLFELTQQSIESCVLDELAGTQSAITTWAGMSTITYNIHSTSKHHHLIMAFCFDRTILKVCNLSAHDWRFRTFIVLLKKYIIFIFEGEEAHSWQLS